MKKLFICLSVLFFSVSAFASNYFSVEWSDFCPQQYRNIDMNKNYKIPVKKYWQQRRIDFEKRKNYCSMQPDADSCLKELREYENNKTQLYYSDLNSKFSKAVFIIK